MVKLSSVSHLVATMRPSLSAIASPIALFLFELWVILTRFSSWIASVRGSTSLPCVHFLFLWFCFISFFICCVMSRLVLLCDSCLKTEISIPRIETQTSSINTHRHIYTHSSHIDYNTTRQHYACFCCPTSLSQDSSAGCNHAFMCALLSCLSLMLSFLFSVLDLIFVLVSLSVYIQIKSFFFVWIPLSVLLELHSLFLLLYFFSFVDSFDWYNFSYFLPHVLFFQLISLSELRAFN